MTFRSSPRDPGDIDRDLYEHIRRLEKQFTSLPTPAVPAAQDLCAIVCPADFTVTAVDDITLTGSGGSISIVTSFGDERIDIIADDFIVLDSPNGEISLSSQLEMNLFTEPGADIHINPGSDLILGLAVNVDIEATTFVDIRAGNTGNLRLHAGTNNVRYILMAAPATLPVDGEFDQVSQLTFYADESVSPHRLKAKRRRTTGLYDTFDLGISGGSPFPGYGSPVNVGTALSDGVATTVTRADHVHALGAVDGTGLTLSAGVLNWDGSTVTDEGAGGGLATTLDFVGAGVSAAVVGGVATVTIAGGAGMTFDSPVSVGTTLADGVDTDAARADHVHDLDAAIAGTAISLAAGVLNWDGVAVQDETIAQGNALTVNFAGAGVTAAIVGSTATITIPGGGGAGSDTTAWHRDGDTVAAEKWLGTVDNFALPFRVNSVEKARLTTAGLLQIPTTGVAGGILLGGDANLYRSAADRLESDDDLLARRFITTGGYTPVTAIGADSAAHPGTTTTLMGFLSDYVYPATTTVEADGLRVRVGTVASAFTLAKAVGIMVLDAGKGAGSTITNAYGIEVQNQTMGVNNYSVAIWRSATQTLWVSSNTDADATTAAAGIAFGLSRDTNLYRSMANRLRTDDDFVCNDHYMLDNAAAIVAGEGTASSRLRVLTTNGASAILERLSLGDGLDGITFGSGRDTNIYRGTTNQLKTDDVFNINNAGGLLVSGTKVVGAQGASVADAVGGITIDIEARAAINAVISRLEAHGLVATV